MFSQPSLFPVDTRSVMVPAQEPEITTNPSAPLDAIAVFQIRKRDAMDFTVDFSSWMAGNGSPALTGATWILADESPKTPASVALAFAPGGRITAVVTPATNAAPSDPYYFDVTATMGETESTGTNVPVIPARRLVRRVIVIVVAG